MAIINSVLIGKGRGSVGNVTLRIAGGDTIASQKISKGAQKIGTLSQVLRRVRLGNLVNAYQALNALGNGAGMAQSFPARGPRVSNFNMFVSRNIGRAGVGDVSLTREQVSRGDVVAAPYVVTEGDLPVISPVSVISAEPSAATQDLFAINSAGGELYVMGAIGRTPAQFFAYLKTQLGLLDGDTITVFSMEWIDGSDAKFNSLQMVVDSATAVTDWSALGFDEAMIGSSTVPMVQMTNRRTASTAGGVSIAVCVGRSVGAGYRISSSSFVSSSAMDAAVAQFNSNLAKNTAAASYGYKEDPYLQQNP